jgi:hypothetical protein
MLLPCPTTAFQIRVSLREIKLIAVSTSIASYRMWAFQLPSPRSSVLLQHLPSTQPPEKMSHFEPNAILRGAQLTVVGALRALKNPGLFTSEHYKQAALAVLAGIVIRLLVAIPVRL